MCKKNSSDCNKTLFLTPVYGDWDNLSKWFSRIHTVHCRTLHTTEKVNLAIKTCDLWLRFCIRISLLFCFHFSLNWFPVVSVICCASFHREIWGSWMCARFRVTRAPSHSFAHRHWLPKKIARGFWRSFQWQRSVKLDDLFNDLIAIDDGEWRQKLNTISGFCLFSDFETILCLRRHWRGGKNWSSANLVKRWKEPDYEHLNGAETINHTGCEPQHKYNSKVGRSRVMFGRHCPPNRHEIAMLLSLFLLSTFPAIIVEFWRRGMCAGELVGEERSQDEQRKELGLDRVRKKRYIDWWGWKRLEWVSIYGSE